MPFSIEPNRDGKCIHVIHTGNELTAESDIVQVQLSTALVENNFNRVVIDISAIAERPTTFQQYKFASQLAKWLPEEVQVALIARPDQTAELEFLEVVTQNRGVNQRTFSNKAEALEWLQG